MSSTLEAAAAQRRKAAIYLRISDDKDGVGLGVLRQRRECEALADRLGWDVVEVFNDNDRSAYSGRERPRYHAMLAAIREGRVEGVIGWHSDRLHRNLTEHEAFGLLCQTYDVEVQTAQGGRMDLDTSGGELTAGMMAVLARYESAHRSERSRAKMAELATAGKWHGGVVPFGWAVRVGEDGRQHMTVDGALDEAEAAEIRDASAKVLGGESLGAICADWNTRGIRTRTGREWSRTTLRQVLSRAANAALREHRGEEVGPAAWQPILDETTWRAVRRVLTDPTRRPAAGNARKHLGSGLYVCGVAGCGATLRSGIATSSSGATRLIYRCSASTSHVHRAAEPLDEFVTELVQHRLARPDAAKILRTAKGADRQRRRIEAERDTLQAQMTEAAEMFASREISRSQLRTITEGLTARLDALEAALAPDPAHAVLADLASTANGLKAVKAAWTSMSLSRRRAVVDALLTVRVLPLGKGSGKAFRPDGIQVEWRR